MALDLEYLDEAVVEASSAAEWYATRSATAAAGFEAELEEATGYILNPTLLEGGVEMHVA